MSARSPKKMALTAERLKQVLSYDPETGIFTRNISRQKRFIGKPTGSLNKDGYIIIKVDGLYYPAHLLAWLYFYGYWPDLQIDHKNLLKHDNKLLNLRLATSSQNSANAPRSKANRSGFKGVYWCNTECKWVAKIAFQKKRLTLGYFNDPSIGHEAYCEAATRLFGEFARVA